ncbi:uridine kinase [Arthrobacter sp. CJ23]|uniref:uridine kinase n=1 Tax=Arthrobacter sp. CJ23 TaxID=2972479 RepID=UPI00215D0F17|nr:uridine kinase [Arthrobacter sp. CJ23]UVJ40838.1 uridine kinase [Arthrobacter sp. CJ23]
MGSHNATRAELLRSLAEEIPATGAGFTLVAVDGVDGSGKSTFADALAEELGRRGNPVVLIRVDDFHNLRAERYRLGRDSPAGFWLDSYDYQALRRNVLDPFGPGGDGRYKAIATDLERDRYVDMEQQQALPGTIVVVEGMFLHRDELAGRWNYSVFLDAPFSETASRMAVRDGSPGDPEHPGMRRYVQGQRLYFQACKPWLRADRIVDNSDWSRPAVVGSVAGH